MKQGSNPFTADKPSLMLKVLDRHDVRYNRNRTGWQSVRCIDPDAHFHGDRNPSGSVNLQVGYYTCHSCGLKGDAFDLMLHLESLKAVRVLEVLEEDAGKEEDTWLI